MENLNAEVARAGQRPAKSSKSKLKKKEEFVSPVVDGDFDNSMQPMTMTVAVIICFAYEPKKIYTKITQCARSQCGQHLGEFDTDWKVRL